MTKTKLAALAVFAALISSTVPVYAATVNGTATVKWNTQAVATLKLNTNYSAAGAQQLTAPTIGANLNGGAGACTATGNGSEVVATVNYGNVTPDSTVTTDCNYNNAINAQVATNSTSWTLTEAASAALPAGYGLCALANNASKAFPFTAAQITTTATQSEYVGAAPANATVGTCTTGSAISTTALTMTPTVTTAYTGAAPAQIGEDLELQIGGAASIGAQTVTVTYTLTAN